MEKNQIAVYYVFNSNLLLGQKCLIFEDNHFNKINAAVTKLWWLAQNVKK